MKHTYAILAMLVIALLVGCASTTAPAASTPIPSQAAPQPPAQQPAAQTAPQTGVQAPPAAANGISTVVLIENFNFNPAEVTIPAGTTVVWTNQDTVDHSIIGDGFSSQAFGRGQSFESTFSTPGTYSYHCGIHPNMQGTIIVQ